MKGTRGPFYSKNGDILLSGASEFDFKDPRPSRQKNAELWVLSKDLNAPTVALGTKCLEDPAVSRSRRTIAWTIDHGDYPGYRATKPVVSDDGKFLALQMAKVADLPGVVWHGIFIYDIARAGKGE